MLQFAFDSHRTEFGIKIEFVPDIRMIRFLREIVPRRAVFSDSHGANAAAQPVGRFVERERNVFLLKRKRAKQSRDAAAHDRDVFP
jgi:hypothetical protein